MRSKLVHAALWSIAGSGSQYFIVFGLLVYLAHVLNPHDFGLMATVSIGLDLGTRIARWGQVELLQQQRYRNDESRNQSLRMSLAIGGLFFALSIALAGPLGRLYQSDQLSQLIYLCAPVFLFSAAATPAEAILRTQYRFNVIAIRNTITALLGSVVAIYLANKGYGAVALAAQRIIQSAVAGLWVWTALDWRPSFKRDVRWSPELAREGTSIMTGTLMPLLVPRSIDLFVGFALGPTQLGLMRVASRINDFVGQLVVMPLVTVANTQLSSLSEDLSGMRRSYLRLTQASVTLMCPALIGLSLVAQEAIPVIFGPKWQESIGFVQVLGLLGIVAPINYYFPAAMMALGKSRMVFRQGLFQVIIGIALAAGAAQISLLAVAIANVIRGTLVGFYNVVDLRKYMHLTVLELLHYLAAPYLGTLMMTIAVLSTRAMLGGVLNPLATLLTLASVGATTYAATLWLGERLGFWPEHMSLMPRSLLKRAAVGN